MRLSEDLTVSVPSDSEVVTYNNTYNGIQAVDNAVFECDGTLHAKDNGSNSITDVSGTSGYVELIEHAGNGDPVDANDITIRATGTTPKTDLPNVPTASDVGAFTGSTTTTGANTAIRTSNGLIQSTNAIVDTLDSS
jgi:hypothetical protein